MRKIKLMVEYDGSAYHGWQRQPNGITIQEVIESVITKITKVKTGIMGAGRTDAGVHAEGQVAHFRTESRMTPLELLKAFNSLLPPDISIKSVEDVPMEFHSIRSSRKKIYRYTILNREFPSALNHGRYWYLPKPLNVDAMVQAMGYLIGCHDFTAFQAANSETKTTVREIYDIKLIREDEYLKFYFEGNGFLKYMVRNIMGTLVYVGLGKMSVPQVKTILESKDRRNAGPTGQPHGLCLVKIFY